MEGAGGVVEGDARFEMFAGVVVEDEGSALVGVVEVLQVVDEGAREGDEFSVSVEALVHDAFEVGLGDEGVLGGVGREEAVLHLV